MFPRSENIKHLAYHDNLTGLLNRNWLHKNINKVNTKYVYFIDINDMKKANKRGHVFGDRHIVNIVNSIPVDKTEPFIRYGGDEFVLLSNIDDKIETNELYSVGKFEFNGDLSESINFADELMIENKRLHKLKNEDKS